jgi:K+-transporting ATPase ATPase C chain
MIVALTLLCGLVYPAAVLGVVQAAFPHQADGSLARNASGQVVGSELIGQPFSDARYFQPRPSVAGSGYDAQASAASNLGPSNPELWATVRQRVTAYRAQNDLTPGTKVPADAVTASASGLDPDISLTNATIQAARVARARHVPVGTVLRLVHQHEDGAMFGIFGVPGVNVLEVNLALDERVAR